MVNKCQICLICLIAMEVIEEIIITIEVHIIVMEEIQIKKCPTQIFFPSSSSSSSSSSRGRRIIPFFDFNNGLFGDDFLTEFLQRMGSRENPTDEEILNELPETQIEDASKLDPEKKNCIIYLEDFKNGDKTIILPCIHIFHSECIKNWLKTQNTCPICKFKLTGENLNPSVDDMH